MCPNIRGYAKLTETEFTVQSTQMGARVYVASMGRFLQVDSVQGGTDNAYVYVTDPVNDFDLDGTFSLKNWLKDHKQAISKVARSVAVASAVIGVGACVVATAGACVAVGVGLAAVGGVTRTAESVAKGKSWGNSMKAGVKSFAVDSALSVVSFAKPVRSMSKIAAMGSKGVQKAYYGGSKAFSVRGTATAFKTGSKAPLKNKALIRYGTGLYTAWGGQIVSNWAQNKIQW